MRFLAVFCLSLLPSCGFYQEKPAKNLNSLSQDPSTLSYALVHQKIFAPYCISCHGSAGGVNLENYGNVKKHISAIEKTAVIEKSMPKGESKLSVEERNLLSAWIKAGAPENPGANLPPTNPEPEEPLKPKFSSIRKRIFEPKCIACHSAGGSASGVPLKNLKDILNSPRDLILPGNPSESGLVIAITREDDRRMPPAEVATKLSKEEISTIEQWILEGAQE